MTDEAKFLRSLIIGAAILLVLLAVVLSAFTTVKAGSVQVVTRFSATTGRVLQPGFHTLIPFVDGTERLNTRWMTYETSDEEKQSGSDSDYKDYPVDTNTSDGQSVDIYYTIRFAIDGSQAVNIVNRYGSEEALVEKVIKTESRIWARNIPRNYEASTLYTGEGGEEIAQQIEEKLRPRFEEAGLVLDSIGLREIRFSPQYVSAIEEKQLEAVRVETEQNKALQAEFRKEATIKDAEAEAERQRLQAQTITQPFLEMEWVKKWSGQVPQIITSDQAGIFFPALGQ